MRIMLKDQAVFAGPRLAFISVDQDVFGLVRLLGNESPFHAGREAGAAASAKIGSLDFIDDFVRLHLECLLDSLVAVKPQMAIEIRSAFAKTLGDDAYFVGMKNKVCH